ncbi:hypothetical protein H5410_056780, partial [Solanum commersonii]
AIRDHPARRKVDLQDQRVPNAPEQVEENKFPYREEFRNKKAKTIGNKSRQQKVGNANRSSFQQKTIGLAPSSASAPKPKNRGHFRREYPKNMQGNSNGGNKAQSSSVTLEKRAATG